MPKLRREVMFDMQSSFDYQELCAEAPSVSPEKLGEDEGETGASEEGGRERKRGQQPLHIRPLGGSYP